MEASGGYERLGFMLLWAHGMECALVNARSVRRFAEAMGHLEKTDRIDAAVIAHYGAVKKMVPTPPPSTAQQRLAALVGRLCQVVGDATINKQRRSAARDAEACASIEAMADVVGGTGLSHGAWQCRGDHAQSSRSDERGVSEDA